MIQDAINGFAQLGGIPPSFKQTTLKRDVQSRLYLILPRSHSFAKTRQQQYSIKPDPATHLIDKALIKLKQVIYEENVNQCST